MSQRAYDEAVGPGGVPRPHYAELLGALRRLDLSSLASGLAEGLSEREVTFRLEGKDDPFRLDAVPRLLTSDEWAPLGAGLSQRVQTLERFVADVYGEREIVAAGVVPAATPSRPPSGSRCRPAPSTPSRSSASRARI